MLGRVPRNFSSWIFFLCLAFVILVSVHDAMLIVVNHEIIEEFEQNPVGLWLLRLHDGNVWLFVCAKLLGTSLVATILVTLYRHREALGLFCVSGLSVFQVLLLGYLTLG